MNDYENMNDDLETLDTPGANPEEVGAEAEQQEPEKVPLSKYMDERRKRRELEQQLRDIETATSSYKSKAEVEDIKKLVLERGYDEDLADVLGDVFHKAMSKVPQQDKIEAEIMAEIEDAAEFNPDIMKHKKEIVEKLKKFKKAGEDVSVEDVMALIKPNKMTMGELKTDIEQKALAARRNVASKAIVNSSPSSPKNPYPLDDSDKKALEGLQKAQPNKNWTAEKYHKLMKT